MNDNISNLDFKRHRLGLTKGLSTFAILNTYKNSSIKLKLELIAMIEVLRYKENNYNEALELIYKFEKVQDSQGLITQLSKRQLDSKVLSNVERLEMAQETNPKPEIPEVTPQKKPSLLKENKLSVIVISSFLVLILLSVIIKANSTTVSDSPANSGTGNLGVESSKTETYIELIPKNGHKYVNIIIDGIPTSFMLDTGASISTVSKSYLNQHIRSGFINKQSHLLDYKFFTMANGESMIAEVWQLPSMKIGPKTIYNVEVAVFDSPDLNEFLLGVSTIDKLGITTIDLNNNKLIVE